MAQTVADVSRDLEGVRGKVDAMEGRLENVEHAVFGNGREGLTYAVPNLRRDVEALQKRHESEDDNMKREAERAQSNRDAFRVEFWAGMAVQAVVTLGGMAAMFWGLVRHTAPLLAIVLLAGLSGCTRIVAPGWSYTSIAQQKSLGLAFDPATGQVVRLEYNTQADPAVEALATIAAGAAKAATP